MNDGPLHQTGAAPARRLGHVPAHKNLDLFAFRPILVGPRAQFRTCRRTHPCRKHTRTGRRRFAQVSGRRGSHRGGHSPVNCGAGGALSSALPNGMHLVGGGAHRRLWRRWNDFQYATATTPIPEQGLLPSLIFRSHVSLSKIPQISCSVIFFFIYLLQNFGNLTENFSNFYSSYFGDVSVCVMVMLDCLARSQPVVCASYSVCVSYAQRIISSFVSLINVILE